MDSAQQGKEKGKWEIKKFENEENMIEKLFTSKIRVKLLEYFIFQKQKSKTRETSRDIGISVSAVSRELSNLVALSILKKEQEHYVLNEECNFLPDLRNILVKTDSFRLELEKTFKDYKIDFAFVFGSFANDNYASDSDIDLFVIGSISQMELAKMLKPIESRLNREINCVIWPLQDLKKKSKSSFIRQIAKRNIIMVKGNEDKIREIIGRK